MAAMTTTQDAQTMVRSDDGFRHEMEPRNLDQMYKLAAAWAKIGLCGVTSGEEAMARMLAGRELGLSTMLSMMSVYVVKGMPSLSAKLKHSLCLDHKFCEEFRLIESSNEKATFRAKRVGEPAQDFTFTIEDAKRAGYIDPKKPDSAWNCNPRRMLEARAKGHAADVTFPDIINGLATIEEMEDARIQVRTTKPSPAAETDKPETVVDAVFVDTKPRDLDAESGAIKEDIMNAKTKEEKTAARKRVAAFVEDVGAMSTHASDLKGFYNANVVHAKSANGQSAAAPPPPPPIPEVEVREPGEEG